MASREELYRALRNADAAGDAEGARKLAAYIRSMPAQQSKQSDPTEGMSTYEKTMAGIGKAMVDTGRGVGQLFGLVSRKDVEEARRLDAPLMNTGAGMAGNIAGNIGMALLPGGALKGAGVVANSIGNAPRIAAALPSVAQAATQAAPALSAGGNALMLPNTIKGAIGVGAGMGALQPSASTGETLLNAGIGGAASAAVPVAVRGFQAARSASEPFYESGRKRILSRALQEVAGDQAPDALANIKAAAAPFVGPSPQGAPARQMMGEIVPGSIPTVGQIARNPGIAALERTASQTDPAVANAYAQRMAQQNAARVNSLEGLAGTDGAREFFGAARDATAEQLYGDAFAKGINQQVAGQLAPQFTKLMERPLMQDAHAVATRLAQNDGINIADPRGSLEAMHYMKKALDEILDKGKQTGLGKLEARQITAAKDELLGIMDQLSPAYANARAEFQAASRPINQMDTASAIAGKSINKLTGNMQPNAFANALTDKTAATASGLKGATLESVMEPAQLNALGAIKDDLANSVYQQTAGRGVGSDTVQKLAYSNMLAQAGVPNWMKNFAPTQLIGNVAARGADAAYGRANRELSNRLAEALLNPQAAAELLQADLGSQNLLLSLARGGAAAGTAVPWVLNGSKQ